MKKYVLPLYLVLFAISFSYGQENQEVVPIAEKKIIKQLDYKDADLKDIVRGLATQFNLNIFVDNSIKKRITLHVVDMEVDQLLHFIANENNLRLSKDGNIYKFLPPEKPPQLPKQIKVSVENGLLTADLNNDDLVKAMRAISEKSGKTILVDRAAKGTINGYLIKIPFEIGLRQLLENNGYRLRKNKNIYIVESEFGGSFKKKNGGKANSGAFYLSVRDSLIFLEVHNASLSSIIQEAARRLDINIFIYGKIDGTINARADSLTFFNLLNLLFKGSDYTYKIQKDIILIGNKSVKGISTAQLIKLNYLKSDKVIEVLPKSIKAKADISPIIEQNGIMVIGTQNVINEIIDYIKKIDKPSPQILIETLVIDMNESNLRDIKIEFGYGATNEEPGTRINTILPGIDVALDANDLNYILDKAGNLLGVSKIGHLPSDFYMKIKALEQEGFLQVHSRPQVATLNGYPADISIGTTQYYKLVTKTPIRDPSQIYISETERFQTIEANISLKIIPWVSGSGEITVEIHPEFRTPVGKLSPEVPPTIQSRALNSTVRLRDGETIVLGGLVQNSIEEYSSGIPILSDIPLLGELFKSQGHNITKTQLLIYVTPYLYYNEE